MSVHRSRVWVAVGLVVLTASLGACGTTAKAVSSAGTTTTSSAPTTTAVTTTSASSSATASSSTTTLATTSTTESSAGGKTACDLLTATDFGTAKVPTTAQAGTDASSNFNLAANLTSTACQYELTGTGSATQNDTIGVTLIVASGAAASDFSSLSSGLSGTPSTVSGLGSSAVYVQMASSDNPGTTDNTLLARSGSTIIEIQGLDIRILDKAQMIALAHTVISRL